MSIELDDAVEVTLTLTEARSLSEDDSGEAMDKLMSGIDEAQGQVHMEAVKVAYVIVKITDDRA